LKANPAAQAYSYDSHQTFIAVAWRHQVEAGQFGQPERRKSPANKANGI
jgi:hypothetical protein